MQDVSKTLTQSSVPLDTAYTVYTMYVYVCLYSRQARNTGIRFAGVHHGRSFEVLPVM
jgi:hypothetical protein